MQGIKIYLIYLAAGIAGITILDILGSFASRRLRFNYAYLAIVSICLYIITGSWLYRETKHKTFALLVVLLMGAYDGTIGWQISKKLKPYYGKLTERAAGMSNEKALQSSLLFSLICGLVAILANE